MKTDTDPYTGSYDPAALFNLPPTPDKESADGKDENPADKRGKAADVKNPSKARKRKPFINPRVTLALGIILIVSAMYMLVAALMFYMHVEEDQSKILGNSIMTLANGPYTVDNPTGPVGAYISHVLLTEWLGMGSFFLIFYIGALGTTLVKLTHFRFWPLTFKCLILAVTSSVVIGFATINYDGIIHWGGLHGHYVNRFLLATTGVWGTLGVSVILVAIVVLIYLTQLTRIYVAWRRRVATRRQRQLELEEQRRATEAKVSDTLKTTVPDAEVPVQPEASEDVVVDFDVAETNQPSDDSALAEPGESDINDDIEHGPELEADTDLDFSEKEQTVAEPKAELVLKGDDDNDPEMSVVAPDIEQASEIKRDVYDPTAELSRFKFPPIDLLEEHGNKDKSVDQQEQEENKERITKTLLDYGIPIQRIKATVGPTVTLYEIVPAEGVRIARIKRLEDDIALSLAALGIRIIAPIPGKGTIGIEVPNKEPQTVSMRSIIASRAYQESKYDLPIAMGSTITNDVFIADLAKIPHLLVAGATGMGKSVGLNAIVTSLLYKKHPAELKFVLIDPKMVEFSLYNNLEHHYLAKIPGDDPAVITDPQKVIATLNSLCVEMDARFELLSQAGARSLKEYNAKFVDRRLNPEKGHRFLPYIVLIIDEFADLIMTAGKEVEMPIARIAQKARAVGIHAIIATQRPSTNVITGIIKANFPGRVAFRVMQMVDSKTILDRTGANQLIGRGDMLFSRDGVMERVQCAFVDTDEVVKICENIAGQPGYAEPYELPEPIMESGEASVGNLTDRDPLFEEAARFIAGSGTASTSSLQRRYSIGYNRAGKIMDQMEAAGIVGPSQGGKPRQVLVDPMYIEQLLG